MPFPKHTPTGILPPFETHAPGPAMSPYPATIMEVAQALCTSPERLAIFRGLLAYRAALREAGLSSDSLQWIDGSFVERLHNREPNDVDVVTICQLLPDGADGATEQQRELAAVSSASKVRHRVDGYFVVIGGASGYPTIRQLVYWYSLFSHRRVSGEWKGLIEVRLSTAEEDAAARSAAEQAGSHGQAE